MPVTRLQSRIAKESTPRSLSLEIGIRSSSRGYSPSVTSQVSAPDGGEAQSDYRRTTTPWSARFSEERSPSPSIKDSEGNEKGNEFRAFIEDIRDELESLPSLASWSSWSSSDSWVPDELPDLPEDLQILEWQQVASGTHGTIRRVKIRYQGSEEVVCIKLFGEEWKAEYERETKSYALMAYRGIRRCIPIVYWKGGLPMSRWNRDETTDDLDEIQYGLVMEWFDDYQEVDYSLLDIPTALAIGRCLDRVHAARIKHGDLQGHNILLVRENGAARVVLIDFSCAWLNCHHYTLDNEYDSFLGNLLDEMDPEILTEEIFKEKFDRPVPRFDSEEPPASTDNAILISTVKEVNVPIALRIAYSTYFCAQILTLFLDKGRVHSYWTSTDHVQLIGFSHAKVASVSFCVILFLLRKEPIDGGIGRRLVYLFTIHCVVNLTWGLWEVINISSGSHKGKAGMDTRRVFTLIFVLVSLCWVSAGVSMLVRLRQLVA